MAVEEQLEQDTALIINATGPIRGGQRLTIANRQVTKLAFYLRKFGTPPDTYYFAIRKVSDDGILVREAVALADSLTEVVTLVEHTFAAPPTVNEEVRILVEYNAGDGANLITTYYKNSNVKAGEYRCYYQAAAYTDYSAGGEDHAYRYTYEEEAPPVAKHTFSLDPKPRTRMRFHPNLKLG